MMATGEAATLAETALTLARRFAAGATMWCVSPRWPAHGRHVAVEFVHPVIVGKRALPAMQVSGPNLAASLRLLARPGDIVLAIGPADDVDVTDILRRCDPWGLTSVWIGAGPRPAAGGADHVVWLDDPDIAVAARCGQFVLRYHLLWELTHVVFEHPGLLAATPECSGPACATCSDDAALAEVEEIQPDGRAAVVARGRREVVDVTLVGPVTSGDLVLVHAGVAITVVEESAP